MGTQEREASAFADMYRFTFFAARDQGRRHLATHVAVKGWRLLLEGHFRLLIPWCEFVESYERPYVAEDTWGQVRTFC